MADKNYFEFLDIPDGSGGSDRWHARDAEAQAGIAQVASAIGIDTSVEFVDLGLPSGTLWAKCNVGATEETGYGKFYKYGKGASEYAYPQSDYTGTENPLAAEADTATVILGAPWHMPTKAQFDELVANTNYSWQTNFNGSGINGGKFTSKTDNTKYIFLPAAGYKYYDVWDDAGSYGSYWSATPNGSSAYGFGFESSGGEVFDYYERFNGCSVRPVADSAPLNKVSNKADKATTYTKAEVDAIVGEAQAGSMFQIYVDPEDMHLKGKPTGYGTFEVVNGHLILHQTE